MFDEPGSNYRPRLKSERPPEPRPAIPVEPAVPLRPWWVNVTTYFFMFVFVYRMCDSTTQSAVNILVQMMSLTTIGVLVLGLHGMRRWGVWLLLSYCVWAMLSPIFVGGYRIFVIIEEVEKTSNRDILIFSELINMAIAFFFYGLIALWYVLNIQKFQKSVQGWGMRGNISYMVLVGLLVLYSLAQINEASHHVELQEEIIEENQLWEF